MATTDFQLQVADWTALLYGAHLVVIMRLLPPSSDRRQSHCCKLRSSVAYLCNQKKSCLSLT